MKRKPLSIKIVACLYCLAPIINLIQAAYINNYSLWGENSLFDHLVTTDWVILFLFPLVGVAMYTIRWWSWYLFLLFSIFVFFYNIYIFFANPNYNWGTIFLFNITMVGLTGYFLKKHIKAPYFDSRLRWWETPSRFWINLIAKVHSEDSICECHILDISETGCFLGTRHSLKKGETIWLRFTVFNKELSCLGRVIRRASEQERYTGYGIMFIDLSKSTQKKIKHLVKTVNDLRATERDLADHK